MNGELLDGTPGVTADRGDDTLLGHGYSVADLELLTCKAAFASWWRFVPVAERRDIARFAIVERLLTAPERPDFCDVPPDGDKPALRRCLDATAELDLFVNCLGFSPFSTVQVGALV